MLDNKIHEFLQLASIYQRNNLNLIASENYASKSVLSALASTITNKYAEGYPGRRYYSGCKYVDQIELLAQERLKELYGANYANVQPHSGSQANQAALLALAQPQDTILSLSLDHGGHLSHGYHKNISSHLYTIKHYFLGKNNNLDYDEIYKLAMEYKPKVIIAGYSCFNEKIDWNAFSQIAKKSDSYLLADISHISGLIAGKVYPNPINYADIVTSTTHKTLRGPRGAFIICKEKSELSKKIDSAVFPGLQGGPFMNVIAAKAIAFQEALLPEFNSYAQRIIQNASALAHTLSENKIDLVFGTTAHTHIILISLVRYGISGKKIQDLLEQYGILVNKNVIPGDNLPPIMSSGIRIGTAALTTRGFVEKDFVQLGNIISMAIINHEHFLPELQAQVKDLISLYPLE
jgi:glycine hydroxymethyltransferase